VTTRQTTTTRAVGAETRTPSMTSSAYLVNMKLNGVSCNISLPSNEPVFFKLVIGDRTKEQSWVVSEQKQGGWVHESVLSVGGVQLTCYVSDPEQWILDTTKSSTKTFLESIKAVWLYPVPEYMFMISDRLVNDYHVSSRTEHSNTNELMKVLPREYPTAWLTYWRLMSRVKQIKWTNMFTNEWTSHWLQILHTHQTLTCLELNHSCCPATKQLMAFLFHYPTLKRLQLEQWLIGDVMTTAWLSHMKQLTMLKLTWFARPLPGRN
jgi:hypothetical protein